MQQRFPTPRFAPSDRPPAPSTTGWATRLYEAADEVFWAARLNLLWLVFTLVGGVVLGIGPATLAAYTLARRRALGETFHPWRAFVTVYRREFGRGSLLVLPLAATTVLLVVNYFYFTALGSAATHFRLVTIAAIVALVVIGAYLLPMSVHYDLRTSSSFAKASLFALTRPAASVLLLFVFTAIVYATATYPLLALVVAVGGWIQLDTWLCLRFFAENEARLHAKGLS